MTKISEADLYGTGKSEVALENSHLKVIVSPHLGGRIVDVKSDAGQFLYTTYPEGNPSGFYSEYGGIEEFLDRPPGYLWRQAWQHKIESDEVSLCIKRDNIFLEKRVSLDEAAPIVKIEYSILNTGPNLIRPAFGIHPEICIGNDAALNNYHIPTGQDILSGGCEQTKKRYVHPSQGWCACTGEKSLVAMLFPDKLLDGVEVHYSPNDTHLNLSPLIYYVGLSPGNEARFTCAMYFGEGNVDSALELWKEYAGKLPSSYGSVSEDRLEMARNFEAPKGMDIEMGTAESVERQLLLEKMERLAEQKDERMEILNLLREKQISAAEAVKRFKLMLVRQ
ncbi:hypothetical protein ACFL6S_13700 [Candidatus Poribacteria bacterium]